MTGGSAQSRTLWVDPGVEEVADGVHRIPLPLPLDGLRAVNVYALAASDGLVLIDGGWRVAAAEEALTTALARLGAQGSDVRTCLVTHMHRDHYTLATRLRERHRTGVALGAGEQGNLRRLQATRDGAPTGSMQRLRRAGAAQLAEAWHPGPPTPEELAGYDPPDRWLADGERVPVGDRALRVLATPGHTAGHVVYVDDAADLLFAGDHVLPHITPSIGFEPAPGPSPLADYLRSLAAVRTEPDRLLLPAHGPAGGSAHARIDALLEHHRLRLADTLAALSAAPGAALEVTTLLRWTRHERAFGELDPFNQMLAINETLAHLQVLVAQGRADCDDTQEVLIFTPR